MFEMSALNFVLGLTLAYVVWWTSCEYVVVGEIATPISLKPTMSWYCYVLHPDSAHPLWLVNTPTLPVTVAICELDF